MGTAEAHVLCTCTTGSIGFHHLHHLHFIIRALIICTYLVLIVVLQYKIKRTCKHQRRVRAPSGASLECFTLIFSSSE